MSTLESIDKKLHDYARLLAGAGFTVYAPVAPRSPVRFFHYSRDVDGRRLYGTVNLPTYPTLGQQIEHHMPIPPSRVHGSSMWISSIDDPLTIEAAREITQPTNRNVLVGEQRNATPYGIGVQYLPVVI